MKKVICFGEVLWDNFQTGKKPGGAPMNVALHLLRNTILSSLISSVGHDGNGHELISFLQSHKLSTSNIQVHKVLPTGIVEVELDENQQATYTIVQPVAWDEIRLTKENLQETGSADVLLFGSLACRSPATRETLYQLLSAAKLKVLDLNLRPPHFEIPVLQELISKCDILKINEDEMQFLSRMYSINASQHKDLLELLAVRCSLQTICVTLGDKGAMVYQQGELYHHPGFQVQVADTVGAGDAFLATFLAGYLKDEPAAKNLARACAAGALVASRRGANPEYSASDIDEFLQ